MKSKSRIVLVFLLLGLAACSRGKAKVEETPKGGAAPPSTIPLAATKAQAGGQPAAAAGPVARLPEQASGNASWPRFHGLHNDNISPDRGLLKQWPAGGPKLLWTAKGMGEGYATVSIADGLVYTSGDVNGQTMVFALDMAGNIKWKIPNGPAWTGQFPGSRGTPTIDSGNLYHENPHGHVICLNARTGEKIWARNILREFNAPNIVWALSESLLIDGDHVICCPGGPKTSVVALDKKTGKDVWLARSTGDNAGYASPCLVEYQGLRMVLTMNQYALIGVNADNGDLLFRHEHKTQYDVNATTPAYHDGQIFITSGYGSGAEMLKLKVEGKKASVEQLWAEKALDNHHGGLVILDGRIYGCSSGDRWICLDWATGKILYSQRFVGKGSLTYADGMLYVLSERSQMGLVPASPEKNKVISQCKLPRGGAGQSWAHPVVCGGRLYIRHGDVLFAFDVRGQ